MECRGEIGKGVEENITRTREDKGDYKRKTIPSSGKHVGRRQPRTIPSILTPTNLIPIRWLGTGNTVLGQQVSVKVINPLEPTIFNIQAPVNCAIHTGVQVLRLVVSGEGLLRLEGAGRGATGS